MSIKFEYNPLSREKSSEIRQRFIDTFVDISKDRYINNIKPIKADDVLYGYGHVYGFLYDCIKDECRNVAKVFEVIDKLRKLGDDTLYVMFDIRAKEHIYLDNCPTLPYPYTKLFPSDTVVEISASELIKIIDNDLNSSNYEELHFGEDIYIFDYTFGWFASVTHDFFTDDNGRETDRICYIGSKAD